MILRKTSNMQTFCIKKYKFEFFTILKGLPIFRKNYSNIYSVFQCSSKIATIARNINRARLETSSTTCITSVESIADTTRSHKHDWGNHQRCGIITVVAQENNCDNYCIREIAVRACLVIRANVLNHGVCGPESVVTSMKSSAYKCARAPAVMIKQPRNLWTRINDKRAAGDR